MRTLALPVALIATLLALGALAVVLWEPPSEAVGVAASPVWAELNAQLAEERAARERLEARVRMLDARLAALDVEPRVAEPTADVDEDAGGRRLPPVAAGSFARGEPAGPTRASEPERARGSFDEGALQAAGLSRSEVQWLKQRWEEGQLESAYLTDRALRESWGMGRLRSARLRQRQDLLDEVGADMYDLTLYATGRENRVVVRDVYAGSAAEASDLRSGDVIVSYAGTRVFEPRDLRLFSSMGEAGLLVTIQVSRGGRTEDLRIERGPLGVSTERQRIQPPLP